MPKNNPAEFRFDLPVEPDAPWPLHRKLEQTAYSLAMYTGRLITSQIKDGHWPLSVQYKGRRNARLPASTPPRARPFFSAKLAEDGAYHVAARFGFSATDIQDNPVHGANLIRYQAQPPPTGRYGWQVGPFAEICQLLWCPEDNVRFPNEISGHSIISSVARVLEGFDRGQQIRLYSTRWESVYPSLS